jgi:hypothetical protein
MSASARKNLILSPFADTSVNMLSSRRKPHLKPRRSYCTSRPANLVRALHGADWQNQVCLYENQAEPSEYFSNGQTKNMLQNTVHPVQELCAVKTQADQRKTQSGTDMTYGQYVNLLLSAASAYDTQFTPKTHFAAQSPRRAVYSHDITESRSDDNAPAYDIDCALDIIQPKTHFAARTPHCVV